MSLDKLFEVAKESARDIIEKQQGQALDQVMLVETSEDKPCLVLGGWKAIPKDRFAEFTAMALRRLGAVRYVFVTEAWVARLSKGSPLLEKIIGGEIRVRDLPPDDREDTVQLIGCERGGDPVVFSAIVDNTPGGRKVRDFWQEKADHIGGRMIVAEW